MLLLAGYVHASGVYKCTLEGHTIFIDRPCVSDVPSDIDMGFPPPDAAPAAAASNSGEMTNPDDQGAARMATASVKNEDIFARQLEVAKTRSDAVRAAVQSHQVLQGMDQSQVETAYGPPVEVQGDRRIYERGGERVAIKFGPHKRVASVSAKRSKRRK